MKPIRLLLLLLALFWATTCQGAIALVSSVITGSTDGNGVTTSSIDTSGANLIVVSVCYNSSATAPTLSDSKSNSWTGLTVRNANPGGNRLYYCVNPTVGSGHTFTATGTTSHATVGVVAFSGAKTSSPFDVENGNSQTFGTSRTTGSITPSENNEVVVSGNTASAGSSLAVDSGMTAITVNADGTNHWGGGIAYKIQTTAAAINPTWSWTTSTSNAQTIASFKASSAKATIPYYYLAP